MTILNPDTLLVRNSEIICGDVDGEIVALKIDSGAYLHLNTSASRIFGFFEQSDSPLTPARICELLRCEYQVSEGDCMRDVLATLEHGVALDMFRLADCH